MAYRAGWSPHAEQRLEQLLQGAPDPEVLAAAAREIDPWLLADLYDPDTMPANLREAHERNDETLERIDIGRRFKNDTERRRRLDARQKKGLTDETGRSPPPQPSPPRGGSRKFVESERLHAEGREQETS